MPPPSNAHAILAHYFHDGHDYPQSQGSLSVAEWAAGLDAYGSRLVPAQEWVDRLLAGRQADEVCVTFDDGLREAYVLALPALQRRGLTAAWNIYTGPYLGVPNGLERARWLRNHGWGGVEAFYARVQAKIGYGAAPADYLTNRGYYTDADRAFRYWRNVVASAPAYEALLDDLEREAGCHLPPDTWIRPEELRSLVDAGHLVGIHTHSHPTDMARLSREAQALEYATARCVLSHLQRRPEHEIVTGSHPCGSYTPAGLAWLAAHGFLLMWAATIEARGPLTAPRWSTGYWNLR